MKGRFRVAGRWLAARRRVRGLVLAAARPAGLLVAWAVRVLPPLAGLLLVAYGAALVYRPAGFIVAGVLLLADVVADRVSAGRRARAGGDR